MRARDKLTAWMKRLNGIRYERGQVVLPIMAMLTLMAILSISSLAVAAYTSQTTASFSRTRAYYIAQTGVERAKAQLKIDPDWRDGFQDVSFGGGMIESVTVQEVGGVITITGTGTYGRTKAARLEVVETVGISGGP